MGKLKRARLSLPVPPHPGTKVGEYVPFYFCPRSLMLYILHKGNHQDVSYRGGQAPIVHLEADLHAVVAAMNQARRRWAFTLSNAAAVYTEFRGDVQQLGDIDWTAVASNDFRDERVKHAKQAEFLVHDSFPWTLVRSIGVINMQVEAQVRQVIASAAHKPIVAIRTGWYY